MKKKVVPVVASVLGASLLLTACGGNKDNAGGAKANDKAPDKQAINLSFASEIPTMDVAKATDGESMNVMRNVFEGLYAIGEDNKPILVLLNRLTLVRIKQSILSIFVIQNGQTVLLLQQKILFSLGNVPLTLKQLLNMHSYSLI